MFGNIFQEKFKKDPTNMTLIEIEKTAIKEVKFLKYAKKIVSSRGNIFKNKNYANDINQEIDKKLNSYNLAV